jgi:hypothetical protein
MAEKRQMVTAVFRDRLNAERAFDALHSRGYSDAEINVLMSDKTRSTYYSGKSQPGTLQAGNHAGEGLGIGGAIGTAVGATLGAIALIGSTIALPAIGPAGLFIAGPLAGALAGGGAGAVAGGLIGVLVGWGIPEDNARAYEVALRDGGVVLGVHPRDDNEAGKIRLEFKNLGGEDVFTCAC